MVGPGVYGGTRGGSAQVGGTYGRSATGNDYDVGGDGYGQGRDAGYDSGGYQTSGGSGYRGENYERGGDDYGLTGGYDSGEYQGSGYADGGYAGSYEDPGETTGDPNYKARRHRPSANDTNVGTLADFAAYGGYDRSYGGGDERYVQGYDPNGYGRW